MTRVATPENETFLLQITEYGTTHHVELLVRKYRLCKQLEVNVDSNNVSAETFSRGMSQEDPLAERASALTQLAESYLNGSNSSNSSNSSNFNNSSCVNGDDHKETSNSLGEKYQIFLHINANATDIDHKVSQSDHCSIENKRFLTTEVARRLACDASLENLTTLGRFHHGLLHKGEYGKVKMVRGRYEYSACVYSQRYLTFIVREKVNLITCVQVQHLSDAFGNGDLTFTGYCGG